MPQHELLGSAPSPPRARPGRSSASPLDADRREPQACRGTPATGSTSDARAARRAEPRESPAGRGRASGPAGSSWRGSPLTPADVSGWRNSHFHESSPSVCGASAAGVRGHAGRRGCPSGACRSRGSYVATTGASVRRAGPRERSGRRGRCSSSAARCSGRPRSSAGCRRPAGSRGRCPRSRAWQTAASSVRIRPKWASYSPVSGDLDDDGEAALDDVRVDRPASARRPSRCLTTTSPVVTRLLISSAEVDLVLLEEGAQLVGGRASRCR